MKIGMMWFDNDAKRGLKVKVEMAAEYYRARYGRRPDMCLVNPGMLASQGEEKVEGIVVRAMKAILPGHLWIGVEEGKQDGQNRRD